MTRAAAVGVVALAISLGAVATPAFADDSDNAVILAETNDARAANGLPPLEENAEMDAVAQAWAVHMSEDGSMHHNPDYASQIPAGWTVAAENVAWNLDSDKVVDAWLDSPGHKANIMADTTDVGIGYFVDADGETWSVQNFAAYP